MKRIPLTRGYFALVDDEDYEALAQHKWYAAKGRNTMYAERTVAVPIKQHVAMHRAILGVTDPKVQV